MTWTEVGGLPWPLHLAFQCLGYSLILWGVIVYVSVKPRGGMQTSRLICVKRATESTYTAYVPGG
jgi:hypothetical protein